MEILGFVIIWLMLGLLMVAARGPSGDGILKDYAMALVSILIAAGIVALFFLGFYLICG